MRGLALAISIVSMAAPVTGEGPPGGSVCVKVRPEACVHDQPPTLADVLVFTGPTEFLPMSVAAQPVGADPGAAGATVVTHEQIEQRLRELGVDVNRVLIGGASVCRIMRPPAGAGNPADAPGAGAAAPVQPGAPAPAPAGQTLAQALENHVGRELAELGGTVQLEFEQASRAFLDLTAPPWEFSIQSSGRSRLGLREFRILIRRDGKTQRTVRVLARVRLSKQVLVARQPLSVGAFVEQAAVGLETRLFERTEDIGCDRVEQAVGQQVVRFVPAGQMIGRDGLKPVDLVERSRPVTLTGAGRNVLVRLTGVALDSGGYGQTVRVRIGEARQERRVLRGVVSGLGTVRIEEDGS